MASTNGQSDNDLKILKATVATATVLISQLQAQAAPAGSSASAVNALNLASDAAALIRAHSTKVSLLIINKPFTASAITAVLRELVSGPLPGLASAVELCDSRYTKAMSEELKYQAGRVFVELGNLLKAVPLDGKILSDDAKNGTGSTKGNGSLAVTGALWQACDAVVELEKAGIAGLLVRKAEQYKATLKDALEELHEWAEEESDGEEGDLGSGNEDAAQRAVDDMFGSQRHIPSDDPDRIRPRLEGSLKRLRLLMLMYQAVVKRRLRTLPSLPTTEEPPALKATDVPKQRDSDESHTTKGGKGASVVHNVDRVVELMRELPDVVDELASAFYELDQEEIDRLMDRCFSTGSAAVELLRLNWDGQEDEFTAWAQKFQTAIKMEA